MKMLRILPYTLITCLSSLLTAQVDENQITTFQAGTPSSAAEVNQNFQALIAAINQNATAIESLGTSAAPSLDNSVFKFKGLGVATGVSTDSKGDHIINELSAVEATLTLSTTTDTVNNVTIRTYSWSESQFLDKLTRLTAGTDGQVGYSTTDTELETEPASTNGTWSLNGQTLTLNGLEIDGTFHVSLGGDTITVIEISTENIGVGNIDSTTDIHNGFILIGTRVQ